MKLKIIQDYNDTELKRKVLKDEIIDVEEKRARVLLGKNKSKIIVAEKIEEEPIKKIRRR